ncbi:MAG: glycerophosphodiester phosphodiesterase family protein [Novosphingobium sp.]|uniref:glycerophosphodiester phosphodiesterase family protein n=1 Tax=Novosphingobium sp. TaxID=1874826 RepID=UPI0032BA697B
MTLWLKRIGFVLALAFLVMTFVNASWIAERPTGYPRLLAVRGISQQPNNLPATLAAADGVCTADNIEVPVHDYIENTLPALQRASGMGAAMVSVDVAQSSDGRIVLLREATLDCRTSGKGAVSAMTLAQLKAIDAGHGYSADGGKSFPLRGMGIGYVPTLEETLSALPTEPILFNLGGQDQALSARLIDALLAAGRKVEDLGDGFMGSEAAIAPIRQRFPKSWAFSMEAARACTSAYQLQGWLGLTPASCKGGTILVPLNRQWQFAGWPNRLIARMAAVGGHIVVTGPASDGAEPRGLDLPEQIGQVPASFNSHIWVSDLWVIGPALHPAGDRRNGREKAETEALIAKRRENR